MERYELLNAALKPVDVLMEAGLNALKTVGLYEPFQTGLTDLTKSMLRSKFEKNNQLEILGLENIPLKGGVLLATNHQSWMDAQVLGVSCPRYVHFIAKDEFLEWPVLRQFFDLVKTVYIRRGGDDEGLVHVASVLKGGSVVAIFPEGTIPGEEDIPRWDVEAHTGLLRGHSGVVRLALMSQVPIVPVGISGTGRAFPPEMFPRLQQLPLERPEPVTVRFGKPIQLEPRVVAAVSRDELRDMTDTVMMSISSLVDHSRSYVPVKLPIERSKVPEKMPPMAYRNNKAMEAKTGVLVLHGFTSDIHTVDELLPYIIERNIPYRFPLLRGHGTRWEDMVGTTHRDWYNDAEAAMLDLLTECERVIIVGLSMGGLVALELAAKHNATTAAVVTIAAALRFADPLSHLTPAMARLFPSWPSPSSYNNRECETRHNRNYPRFATDAFASLMEYSKDIPNILSFVRVPLLILAARKDKVVAPRSANIAYNRVSSKEKEIAWFDLSGHEMLLDLEGEAVCRRIDQYLGTILGVWG